MNVYSTTNNFVPCKTIQTALLNQDDIENCTAAIPFYVAILCQHYACFISS